MPQLPLTAHIGFQLLEITVLYQITDTMCRAARDAAAGGRTTYRRIPSAAPTA